MTNGSLKKVESIALEHSACFGVSCFGLYRLPLSMRMLHVCLKA